MKPVLTLFVIVAACAVACRAQSKGICPPSPALKPRTHDHKRSDKITLEVLLSDTGYVCDATVSKGIDKKFDADAESAVRQWHFEPAKKDGRPVPVVINVEVQYKRDANGNLVLSSHPPTISGEWSEHP